MRVEQFFRYAGVFAYLICALSVGSGPARAQSMQPWVSSGNGARNQHVANSPATVHQLSFGSVRGLKVRWFYATNAGVSATPTVEPGGVYVVSEDNLLTKLDPDTGALIWQHSLPDYVGATTGSTKTSPALAADRIVVGINGYVLAINKTTGALLWKTLVESHPLAGIHSSPIIVGNQVFTGVMAGEESYAATHPDYVATVRGSAVALDLTTGALQWKTYTVPEGYAGGDIWGSSPAADPVRGLVYFTTGNNFKVPASVGACIRAAGTSQAAQRACQDPSDYVDSFVALNMTTGAVVWARMTTGADAWMPQASCSLPSNTTCPTLASSHRYDVDFGQGPDLFFVDDMDGTSDDRGGTSGSWVLGAGQKSGTFWGLNPANGGLLWSTQLFNGCCEILWGHAVDTAHGMIYVPVSNSSTTTPNNLAGRLGVAVPNWFGGFWSGLDTRTGHIQFQVPAVGQALDNPARAGDTPGGLSVANGIVFGGSTSGYMVAFDKTGYVHWTYPAGGVVAGSPAIFHDRLYWGVGHYRPAVAGQKTGIYCFSFE